MNVLDLFSGIGGFSLGLERAGMRTVAFCEIDPYCQAVLRKHWPNVPIFAEVRDLRGSSLDTKVSVICGGFPCQDISDAGTKTGIHGLRSGLWFEFARLIRELRPQYAIVENVAALLYRGLGDILGDLAGIGYDAQWSVVSACAVGAPHMRRRVFIVAYPNRIDGWQSLRNSLELCFRQIQGIDGAPCAKAGWRARLANPSALYGNADGLPARLDRSRAIGNAIVPQITEIIGRAIINVELQP